MAEHRLMLIEGAKYSPQDSPVERVWVGLKLLPVHGRDATGDVGRLGDRGWPGTSGLPR